jgi:hypothetical protein
MALVRFHSGETMAENHSVMSVFWGWCSRFAAAAACRCSAGPSETNPGRIVALVVQWRIRASSVITTRDG